MQLRVYLDNGGLSWLGDGNLYRDEYIDVWERPASRLGHSGRELNFIVLKHDLFDPTSPLIELPKPLEGYVERVTFRDEIHSGFLVEGPYADRNENPAVEISVRSQAVKGGIKQFVSISAPTLTDIEHAYLDLRKGKLNLIGGGWVGNQDSASPELSDPELLKYQVLFQPLSDALASLIGHFMRMPDRKLGSGYIETKLSDSERAALQSVKTTLLVHEENGAYSLLPHAEVIYMIFKLMQGKKSLHHFGLHIADLNQIKLHPITSPTES